MLIVSLFLQLSTLYVFYLEKTKYEIALKNLESKLYSQEAVIQSFVNQFDQTLSEKLPLSAQNSVANEFLIPHSSTILIAFCVIIGIGIFYALCPSLHTTGLTNSAEISNSTSPIIDVSISGSPNLINSSMAVDIANSKPVQDTIVEMVSKNIPELVVVVADRPLEVLQQVAEKICSDQVLAQNTAESVQKGTELLKGFVDGT